MSAGSDASNLGYGNTAPFSNVNGQFVNVGSTNNPANFSSNEVPGLPGLAGAKNNVVAAQGVVPGICMKGGRKKRWSLAAVRRKIKNITRQYKRMRAGSRRSRSRKQMVARAMQLMRARQRSVAGGKRRSRRGHRHSRRCRHGSRKQRGGYAQYQNNLPMTNTYSTGGYLSANNSALANPVPYTRLSNCTNCVDNYNHYTNQGFPSKGH